MYHLKAPLPRDPQIDAWLAAQSPAAVETARWLIALVRDTIPDCREGIYHQMPSFAPAGGPIACHVTCATRYASLGFGHGAQLTDPDGLLEGSGRSYRAVKLKSPGALPAAPLQAFLIEAMALAAP